MDSEEELAAQRIGQVVGGRWTLERVLGVGGMAAVYAAREAGGGEAALKLLHPEMSVRRDVRERFLREGYVANSIDHPSVGYILDCKAMSGMPKEIIGTTLEHGAGAGHFHTNCPDGLGPGMGSLDFRPILGALHRSGYRGWISAEPFQYDPDPETVAEAALRTLREAQHYGT